MSELPERQFVLSQGVATAAYDQQKCVLDVEFYNGLVYRFFDVCIDTGKALFQEKAFDQVFSERVVKIHRYELVDKLLPVYLG